MPRIVRIVNHQPEHPLKTKITLKSVSLKTIFSCFGSWSLVTKRFLLFAGNSPPTDHWQITELRMRRCAMGCRKRASQCTFFCREKVECSWNVGTSSERLPGYCYQKDMLPLFLKPWKMMIQNRHFLFQGFTSFSACRLQGCYIIISFIPIHPTAEVT